MAEGWTREEIEARVDELKSEHSGKAFARAIRKFADESLDANEREVLRDLLVERAGEAAGVNEEVSTRLREGGWFRRTVRRLEETTDFEKRRRPS